CWPALPLAPVLGSTGSATDHSALFVGFVATTTESDFSGSCIIGFDSSSSRCGPGGVRPQAKPETSRFPRKELPHMPGSSTTPGWAAARTNAPVHVAFRDSDHVGARNYLLSRLNGWPMHSPVNASSASSRIPTHDSGPMRLATPSSQRTFTAYSLPVSTGAPEIKNFDEAPFVRILGTFERSSATAIDVELPLRIATPNVVSG